MTIFSFRYIRSTLSNNSKLTTKIIKNEKRLLKVYNVTINISRVDDEILAKCLDRDNDYDSLSIDVSEIKELKNKLQISDSISDILDSLILKKEMVFNSINSFSRGKVNFEDVTSKRYIISSTKSSIFRKTKTEYTSYDYIDTKLLKNEYNRINRIDYNELNTLIEVNNDLTMNMRNILNDYSKKQFILNVIEYDTISNEMSYSMTIYVVVLILLMFLYVIIIFLLISDIRKKSRSENRDKYLISMLINKFS